MSIATNRQGRDTASIDILPPPRPLSEADEINHRIANSLQLLSAMVSVEAREIGDAKALAVLHLMQRRIAAVASVHRHLYKTQAASDVDLGAYLHTLAADLELSWAQAGRGRILVDAGRVEVRSDEATSIGIIVSELACNAFKYAYTPEAPGDLRVIVRAMPVGGYMVEVADRGCGMASGRLGTGYGSRLIDLIAARLGGRCSYHDAQPGTRFLLFVGAC